MNKRQKRLIEILEKEGLMDKELKFGCAIKVGCYEKRCDENWCNIGYKLKGISNGIATNSKGVVLINKINNVIVDEELNDNTQSFSMMNYGDKTYIIEDIIGQYSLGNILQRCLKQDPKMTYVFDRSTNTFDVGLLKKSGIGLVNFEFDLTKPPMERTEKQNKELVEFMEKILETK